MNYNRIALRSVILLNIRNCFSLAAVACDAMPNLRVILFIVLVVGTMLLHYMSSHSSTTIIDLIVRSPTLTYKVIVMDERQPFYKLATVDGKKPDVNGDRAQATVVKHLQLVDKCRRDPSLIVVDVGAFLGRMGLFPQPNCCRRSLPDTNVSHFRLTHRRFRIVCSGVRLSSLSIRSAT
jgi:hypothetical protein